VFVVVRKSAAAGDVHAVDRVVEHVLRALDGFDIGDASIDLTIGVGGAQAIGKASAETERVLQRPIPVFKTTEDRFVLGIVLEPTKELNQPDSQNDVYSADEVREAAYGFMEDYQAIGLQHRDDITDHVRILLNWITLEDTVISGQDVAKGTWLLGLRILDDALWQSIKDGDITGFSIGGVANRQPTAA
jgi:hypothetical protein